MSGCDKHIDRIDSHNDNLIKKFNVKKPNIWLLVEDAGLMGSMFHSNYLVDGYPEFSLLPIFYEDIQDKIVKASIEGIIFASTFPISNCLVFIRNNTRSFEELQKYYHFSDNVAIQFFNDSSYACNSFLVAEVKE